MALTAVVWQNASSVNAAYARSGSVCMQFCMHTNIYSIKSLNLINLLKWMPFLSMCMHTFKEFAVLPVIMASKPVNQLQQNKIKAPKTKLANHTQKVF